jgi:hypothetical protein
VTAGPGTALPWPATPAAVGTPADFAASAPALHQHVRMPTDTQAVSRPTIEPAETSTSGTDVPSVLLVDDRPANLLSL